MITGTAPGDTSALTNPIINRPYDTPDRHFAIGPSGPTGEIKAGLGGDVRCVVRVAMLTEGWDANTVTHILGVRAYGSQLLCEQVVGRGLRRRSYALDDDGYFAPEYANVYGIPFAFIPSDRVTAEPPPRPPAALVESVPERWKLRIEFPRLDGYRVEIPDEPLIFDATAAPRFVIGPSTVPTQTDVAGIIGEDERVADDPSRFRPQQIAFALARRLLHERLVTTAGDTRAWEFPQVVAICRTWLDTCVDVEDDVELLLIVSGGQKSPGPTQAKAETARNQWCPAVNNHGGFGRWGYVEITSMSGVRERLAEAIELLYADAAIAGDPDLLDTERHDYRGRHRGAA